MKRIIILLIWTSCQFQTFSQKHKPDHLSIAVTTLHTDFPFGSFSKLFTREFHPGLEVGTGFKWKTKGKHDWFQDFKFGYSYQRYVQHSLTLYSELGYRHSFLKTFNAITSVGAGYLHAIAAEKIFVLQNDGTYKKKTNLGRPQVMACLNIGLSKKFSQNGSTVFLIYQQRLQFPFIKSYVPLLPANMLQAGVSIAFKSKH